MGTYSTMFSGKSLVSWITVFPTQSDISGYHDNCFKREKTGIPPNVNLNFSCNPMHRAGKGKNILPKDGMSAKILKLVAVQGVS